MIGRDPNAGRNGENDIMPNQQQNSDLSFPDATETEAVPSVTVTANALDAIRECELPDGGFLRIRVIPGGCSGQTYSVSADDELFITDLILYEQGRIRIVTDPESAQFIEGLQIDYSDDLIRSGFRFSNPNASGCCGCGSSFET